MDQLLGAHTSTSGGVSKSVDLAEKLGFTAMQIFTKNNNRWFQKLLEEKEIKSFKIKLEQSQIKFVVSHDSYLINLCAKDKTILGKSRIALLDELERCELLGIPVPAFVKTMAGKLGRRLFATPLTGRSIIQKSRIRININLKGTCQMHFSIDNLTGLQKRAL